MPSEVTAFGSFTLSNISASAAATPYFQQQVLVALCGQGLSLTPLGKCDIVSSVAAGQSAVTITFEISSGASIGNALNEVNARITSGAFLNLLKVALDLKLF